MASNTEVRVGQVWQHVFGDKAMVVEISNTWAHMRHLCVRYVQGKRSVRALSRGRSGWKLIKDVPTNTKVNDGE